jgi:hypothetical protein
MSNLRALVQAARRGAGTTDDMWRFVANCTPERILALLDVLEAAEATFAPIDVTDEELRMDHGAPLRISFQRERALQAAVKAAREVGV